MQAARPGYNPGGQSRYPHSPYRPPYRSPYRTGIRYGAGYGYGWPGWYGPGYPYLFDDSTDTGDSQVPNYDAQAYAAEPPDQDQSPDSGPWQEPPPPWPYSRLDYNPSASPPPSAPLVESAVTLIFKDGRPSEQVRNYILSRDTITVWDQHPREIPINQLDLAATEKANREAGIDFHLPESRQ
jgi:hypothetical protein